VAATGFGAGAAAVAGAGLLVAVVAAGLATGVAGVAARVVPAGGVGSAKTATGIALVATNATLQISREKLMILFLFLMRSSGQHFFE
jgi:hypothetical protein